MIDAGYNTRVRTSTEHVIICDGTNSEYKSVLASDFKTPNNRTLSNSLQYIPSGTRIQVIPSFKKVYGNNTTFISDSFFVPTLNGVTLETVVITGLGYFTEQCSLITDGNGYYHVETTNEIMLEYCTLVYVISL